MLRKERSSLLTMEFPPVQGVKSVQIRSFSWSVFSCIGTEYGDLRSKSVKIQENTDQEKHFARSDGLSTYDYIGI